MNFNTSFTDIKTPPDAKMKGKYKKLLIVLLIFSIVFSISGTLFSIIACHGECGSDIHGGMWTWVCPRFYVPISVCIVMIIVGVAGIFGSTILLAAKTNPKT